MTTKIQTFGPRSVHEGRIERYEYYAEAIGPDGRMYYATGRGRPTPSVADQEELRARTGELLRVRMIEEGVWEE